ASYRGARVLWRGDSRSIDHISQNVERQMRHLEDAESMALIAWRDLHVRKHKELRLLAHIPNGGYRNVREAARLKKMGVLPGVSDYFLPVPMAVNGAMPKRSFHRSEYHGLWIELKSAAGRLSE